MEADSSDVHSGILNFKCKANNHSFRRTATYLAGTLGQMLPSLP